MNKIAKAFESKKALVAFITGGDPNIETTEKLIVAMADSGADIIEIGIPFSDPVAEGPVIEDADERALAGGCTVDKLFDMVKRVRKRVDIPLLFMTYANPVFAYGTEKFMANCADCGIDGVIVPDIPFEERDELSGVCKEYGIAQIYLVAPTSKERVEMIAAESEGFLYCVSSIGVTGMRDQISTNVAEMVSTARQVTNTPCAVGFGISTPAQARTIAAVSDGVIIGSAIVQLVADFGEDSIAPVSGFIKQVRDALDS